MIPTNNKAALSSKRNIPNELVQGSKAVVHLHFKFTPFMFSGETISLFGDFLDLIYVHSFEQNVRDIVSVRANC